jgi:hypothetical protein
VGTRVNIGGSELRSDRCRDLRHKGARYVLSYRPNGRRYPTHHAPRLAYWALLPILIAAGGCNHAESSEPGETFSAGYIFAEEQSKVSREFIVRNTTSEAVKILDVQKSCTCTSFKLGKYDLVPGETTTLTVEVDLTPTYMQKFATCILKTNHPRLKDWAYNIKFTSLPLVLADPPDLNLGPLTIGGSGTNAVRHASLDLFGKSKIELTRNSFSVPEELEVKIVSDPEFRLLQRDVWSTRYKVAIGLSAKGREAIVRNLRSGLTTKTVGLRAGGSGSKNWPYSVYWQALSPLASSPSYLSFGNLLDPIVDRSRRVVISSSGGGEFRVVSVDSLTRDIRIDYNIDSQTEAAQHLVTFSIAKAERTNENSDEPKRRFLSGTIRVLTSSKLVPTVEIPWSAMLDPLAKPRPGVDQSKTSSTK